ncbi:MAG: glutamine-hydrolyzing carbamoyl-phosphate synthase small subunit [Bacteroidota bacterium]
MTLPMSTPGSLHLQDGRIFEGWIVGFDAGNCGGELCFNTSMTGYQEMFTDPSYRGQMLVHNFVHLGNYGAYAADQESDRVQISGVVVRNFTEKHSRLMADSSLQDYMVRNRLMGIRGVDTRALVRHIRNSGAMNAVILSHKGLDGDHHYHAQKALQDLPSMVGLDLSALVTTAESYRMESVIPGTPKQVVVMDYGVKRNMLHHLTQRGCELRVLPASATIEDVMACGPQGVLLSNGPGDPAAMDHQVGVVRGLLERRVPLMGICLGHQLLARAAGLDTFKMHNGHRGSNHPVLNLRNNRSEITSQNHGFAVNLEQTKAASHLELTHINLNDQTVEGLALRDRPAFSVQYHPESNPGPHDSHYLFDDFVSMMD